MDGQERDGSANGVIAVAARSAHRLTRLIEEVPSRLDGDRPDSLVVVGVGDELGWFASAFAPMSGTVTLSGMRAEMLTIAGEAARQAVRAAPQHLSVRHYGCLGWRDPRFHVSLGGHGCRRLIVDRTDLKPRQLRRLERSSAQACIELIALDGHGAESPVAADARGPLLADAYV